MGKVVHGLYLPRTRTCDGCGRVFVVDRTRAPAARYCSNACRKQHGTWSFQAFNAGRRRQSA